MTVFPPGYVKLVAGVLRSVFDISRIGAADAHRAMTDRSIAPGTRLRRMVVAMRGRSSDAIGLSPTSRLHGIATLPLTKPGRPSLTPTEAAIRSAVRQDSARARESKLGTNGASRVWPPSMPLGAAGSRRIAIPTFLSLAAVGARTATIDQGEPKRTNTKWSNSLILPSGGAANHSAPPSSTSTQRPATSSILLWQNTAGRTSGRSPPGATAPTVDRRSVPGAVTEHLWILPRRQQSPAATSASAGGQSGDTKATSQFEAAHTEIHLDGELLGQWVVNHLEQTLMQPSTSANFVTSHGLPVWPGQSPFI